MFTWTLGFTSRGPWLSMGYSGILGVIISATLRRILLRNKLPLKFKPVTSHGKLYIFTWGQIREKEELLQMIIPVST